MLLNKMTLIRSFGPNDPNILKIKRSKPVLGDFKISPKIIELHDLLFWWPTFKLVEEFGLMNTLIRCGTVDFPYISMESAPS